MQSKRPELILSPSLLSADFARLGQSVSMLEQAGADWLHVDVMDGHFVPNITIGPMVVKALRPLTKMTLDCHLMIERPDTYVEAFAKAGADIITVHVEACTHLNRTIQFIRSFGIKAGVAINPATPVEHLSEILSEVEMVLLMSVNPGFGGQAFIPSLFRRAETLSQIRRESKLDFLIQADGGIKLDNIREVYESGVDVVVSGSGIFETPDPAATIREMKQVCRMFSGVVV